jgi:hypothetical protein
VQADLLPLTWEARELARLLARPYFFEVVVRKNPHAMTYVFQGAPASQSTLTLTSSFNGCGRLAASTACGDLSA